MKDLLLLRHAKAHQAAPGQDDRDRALSRRGREAAAAMARWMVKAGWRPDLVLCSPSARTRETAAIIRAILPAGRLVDVPALYLASPAELRKRIRDADPAAGALMIVGHNPGLAELAHALGADNEGRFPTAAAAWFRSDAATWKGIFDAAPSRVALMTPALLEGEPQA